MRGNSTWQPCILHHPRLIDCIYQKIPGGLVSVLCPTAPTCQGSHIRSCCCLTRQVQGNLCDLRVAQTGSAREVTPTLLCAARNQARNLKLKNYMLHLLMVLASLEFATMAKSLGFQTEILYSGEQKLSGLSWCLFSIQ